MTPVAPRNVNDVSYVTRITIMTIIFCGKRDVGMLESHFSRQVMLQCHFSW